MYTETKHVKWIFFIVIFSTFILIASLKRFLALFILIPLLIFTFPLFHNFNNSIEINGNYKIVQIISSGYVINEGHKKILLKSKLTLNLDDLINVKSSNISSIKNKKEKYYYYLKSLNINFISNNAKISKENNITSIRSKITNYLLKGPDFYVKFISLILMGKNEIVFKNDFNKELYEKAKYISILHLFVISGFHINLIMVILLWVTKKIRINIIYANIINLILIGMYLYFLNFPISSLRAYLFIFIHFINKVFLNNKFTKINILTFIMLLMFFFNPFVIFSLSFIFTFTITFSILFVIDIKNKWIRVGCIVLFAYLSSIMISIYINGWFNIFGIINSIIFSPIVF